MSENINTHKQEKLINLDNEFRSGFAVKELGCILLTIMDIREIPRSIPMMYKLYKISINYKN